MSDFTLSNGLINVGGILTETKTRKTRASTDAKLALGLDPNKEYKSSIGIASVQEQIVITSPAINARSAYTFPLGDYYQSMKLVSLYSTNPQDDEFELRLVRPDLEKIFELTVNRNLLDIRIPDLTIPQDYFLKIVSAKGIGGITGVFVPVDVIDLVVPEEVSGGVL